MLAAVRDDPYSRQQPRRPTHSRSKIALLLGTVAALGIAAVVVALTMPRSSDATTGSSQGSSEASTQSAAAATTSDSVANMTLSLAATGDIVMGNAPSGLPANNGSALFSDVTGVLGADLQMGNLEQTLTDDTGTAKCSSETMGKTCFAFRTPPSYAQVLADAGFDLVNMANNHAYDFGQKGYTNTKAALDSVGIEYTGAPDAITVVTIEGVRVAVIGFAPYSWSNDPNDTTAAAALVAEAANQADLVVVQVHMGAEGADQTHVTSGTETYLGENRGDPIAFSHAVVDAGADLVIGHGPHVMRGMEFYQGRLIAYSLGNFAGYHALGYTGVVGVGGVLKITIKGDGTFVDGTLSSTVMVAPGVPTVDSSNEAVELVGDLSTSDFPSTGALIDSSGAITQPA